MAEKQQYTHNDSQDEVVDPENFILMSEQALRLIDGVDSPRGIRPANMTTQQRTEFAEGLRPAAAIMVQRARENR